ncbi:MAG: 50S ribosomal protein L25 [Kiritimatiellales bacterium]|nr:50S ribosomal protein L25 [Pontiella sp.]NNJ70864.1 50S ribosomal protein L25 [Kiritimatiellales bacterium]
MEDVKLIAKKRDLEGTSNVRRMRKDGLLPAVIYGAEKDPVSVEINTHDFEQILHHSASESIIVDVALDGEGTISTLVKDVQHHPVSSDLMHVDLLRIAANKPIAVEIPVVLIGESAGVKAGGLIDHVMHSIDVECLPGDMVESFEIDVSELEIGDSLNVSDLKLSSKFKLLVDEESIVASVAAPRVEEELEEEEAEGAEGEGGAEPEVITEKKAEDAE